MVFCCVVDSVVYYPCMCAYVCASIHQFVKTVFHKLFGEFHQIYNFDEDELIRFPPSSMCFFDTVESLTGRTFGPRFTNNLRMNLGKT